MYYVNVSRTSGTIDQVEQRQQEAFLVGRILIDVAPHVATLADSLLKPEPNRNTNTCTVMVMLVIMLNMKRMNMTFKTMQKMTRTRWFVFHHN